VFFIQDAMKFPDLMHAMKPEPHHGMPQASSAHDTFWDFVSLMPESTHALMWLMSDRALPRSLRMMDGFGVHTYRFINAHGVAHFVKFHWKPKLGRHALAWDEARRIAGLDPTSTAATCGNPSPRATAPSGSWACSWSRKARLLRWASTCSIPPS
jgi:catalase